MPVLRELRRKVKMTQKELADKAGIHLATVIRFELGLCEPKPETLSKIAGVLGIPPEKIKFKKGAGKWT